MDKDQKNRIWGRIESRISFNERTRNKKNIKNRILIMSALLAATVFFGSIFADDMYSWFNKVTLEINGSKVDIAADISSEEIEKMRSRVEKYDAEAEYDKYEYDSLEEAHRNIDIAFTQPAYIPEGFAFKNASYSKKKSGFDYKQIRLCYSNAKDKILDRVDSIGVLYSYSESLMSGVTSEHFREGTKIKSIEVNGQSGYIILIEGKSNCFMSLNIPIKGRHIAVYADMNANIGDKDTLTEVEAQLLKLAKSILE